MPVCPSIRAAVLFAWAGKCFYCGRAAEVVDHIQPKQKDGSDEPTNLIACCTVCNRVKADRWLPSAVLDQALESAASLSAFVETAAETFQISAEIANARVRFGSHPLDQGGSGMGRNLPAQRTRRPARTVAKEMARIVRRRRATKKDDDDQNG